MRRVAVFGSVCSLGVPYLLEDKGKEDSVLTRKHLDGKLREAEKAMKKQVDTAHDAALPVAAKAVEAGDKISRAVSSVYRRVTTQASPGLLAGTVAALLSLRVFRGWKLRGGIILGTIAAWIVLAPDTTSDVSKYFLTKAQQQRQNEKA